MTSTSKRQRELARRRAERQAERRAQRQRQRRRRNILTSLAVFSLVLLVVLGFTVGRDLFDDGDKDDVAIEGPSGDTTPGESESPGEEVVACGAEKPKATSPKQFPKEPPLTIDKNKKYTAKITTSCGVIEVQMLADKAPRTVNSFAFLSKADYFDGTFCHRMTEGGLTVLQCGDPTGSGSGDPGYKFADENLKGAKYTRGVVAMANSGPGTNGSQFFFVIKDSQLGPNYTPWGKVTKGLDVLDKILAIGIAGDAPDGAPKEKVYLEDFTVTGA